MACHAKGGSAFGGLRKDGLNVGIGGGSEGDQIAPAAQEIASGAHFFWVIIGVREILSAHEIADGVGVQFVVFVFAAGNGFHVQSVAEIKRDVCLATAIGQPIPVVSGFDANSQVRQKRLHAFFESFKVAFQIAAEENISCPVDHCDEHGGSV